ncbi:MAG TPA: hypothetical protein VH369_01880 [Bryobacteraceae bacterium]|jgi:membrane-bound ClpP family serine protease
MNIGPNVAFVLVIFGLLAIYWEFLRPGRIYPGMLGAAGLLWGVWSLWRISPTSAGLKWLTVAAVLFLVESCWNTRYLAGLGGTATVILSAYTHHVALYLAVPLGLAFGCITIWLAAAAKRARRNKRVDL